MYRLATLRMILAVPYFLKGKFNQQISFFNAEIIWISRGCVKISLETRLPKRPCIFYLVSVNKCGGRRREEFRSFYPGHKIFWVYAKRSWNCFEDFSVFCAFCCCFLKNGDLG